MAGKPCPFLPYGLIRKEKQKPKCAENQPRIPNVKSRFGQRRNCNKIVMIDRLPILFRIVFTRTYFNMPSLSPDPGFQHYYKACRKGDAEVKAVTVNESPVRANADASEITGLPRDNFEVYEISKEQFLRGKKGSGNSSPLPPYV
jgi:hypothetical protein